MKNLKQLLIEVSAISKKYEDIAKTTGENFNIFNVLGLSTREVRTHSAFIAELLNPKGSHDQGTVFLDLFIEQLNNKLGKEIIKSKIGDDFGKGNIDERIVEKHISSINKDYTEGGSIDIIVEDNKKAIIIENKIYAKDQKNQLLRYYNYGITKDDFILLYLTLEEKDATEYSTKIKEDEVNIITLKKGQKSELKLDEDYYNITYKNDIKDWLGKCKEEAVNHPLLRETISQYINLIKQLTRQTMNDKMNEEVKKIIIKNPEYILSIEESYNALQSIIEDAKNNLRNIFNKKYKHEEIKLRNGIFISTKCDIENEGLWIGYQAKKDNEPIEKSEPSKYTGILRNVIEPECVLLDNHPNYIGWYFPKPFKGERFEKLDINVLQKIINDEENEEYINKLVDSIIKQANDFYSKLDKALSRYK